jgi:hypothetical protein
MRGRILAQTVLDLGGSECVSLQEHRELSKGKPRLALAL